MSTQFQEDLTGIGKCIVEEPDQVPPLVEKRRIPRPECICVISEGSDGYTYWQVLGRFTSDYNRTLKIIETM